MIKRTALRALTENDITGAMYGCTNRSQVLRNLGYARSGQSLKALDERAEAVGVELPGGRVKSMLEFIPLPKDTVKVPGMFMREDSHAGAATSMLPPSRGLCLTDVYDKGGQTDGKVIEMDSPARFDFPGSSEAFDEASQSRRQPETNLLPPSDFQRVIDKLTLEIEKLQGEIDKRCAVIDALNALDA